MSAASPGVSPAARYAHSVPCGTNAVQGAVDTKIPKLEYVNVLAPGGEFGAAAGVIVMDSGRGVGRLYSRQP